QLIQSVASSKVPPQRELALPRHPRTTPPRSPRPPLPAQVRRDRPSPLACDAPSAPGTARRSFVPTFVVTPRKCLRIGAAPLALDELRFDVVLGDEIFKRLMQHLRHRHCFDQIGTGFRECLPFRRVRGNSGNRVGPEALRRRQYDPDTGSTGGEIVVVARGFRTIEIDRHAPGIKQRRSFLLAYDSPRRHLRFIRQHAGAAPDKIDPRRIRLAALDHDADRNSHQWQGGGTHVAASRCLIGNPVNRFCGFIRTSRSEAIASIRYAGSCLTESTTSSASAKASRNNASSRAIVR